MYSVKAVSQATGISPETLRAWERRYNAVTPVRESNGRRSYSAADVARLQTLKRLSDLGHPIGKLAALDESALDGLVAESMETDTAGRAASNLVRTLLHAVHEYDENDCEQALGLAVATMAPDRLVHDVLGPALRAVGDQWHRGEVSIVQERLLSTRVRRLLLSLMNAYRQQSAGPKVVFAALSGEQHGLGCLFGAYIASSLGAMAHFLDANLPAEEIIRFADAISAEVIALSIVLSPVAPDTVQQLERIASHGSPARAVWVGGPGAASLAETDKLPDGCTFVHSLLELESLLRAVAE